MIFAQWKDLKVVFEARKLCFESFWFIHIFPRRPCIKSECIYFIMPGKQ